MSGYVYIEYPKCLYQRDGTTLVVENGEEEESAAQMGWLTAEQYHHPEASVPPAAPEGEEGYKPEEEPEAEPEEEPEEEPESDGTL